MMLYINMVREIDEKFAGMARCGNDFLFYRVLQNRKIKIFSKKKKKIDDDL
jgi:hypothetical protein